MTFKVSVKNSVVVQNYQLKNPKVSKKYLKYFLEILIINITIILFTEINSQKSASIRSLWPPGHQGKIKPFGNKIPWKYDDKLYNEIWKNSMINKKPFQLHLQSK